MINIAGDHLKSKAKEQMSPLPLEFRMGDKEFIQALPNSKLITIKQILPYGWVKCVVWIGHVANIQTNITDGDIQQLLRYTRGPKYLITLKRDVAC